jgi:hypothetical protein
MMHYSFARHVKNALARFGVFGEGRKCDALD